MFSINSNFSISRLNNAEITAFYINVQKAITTNDPTKLGVVGILPTFGSKLQELIDRVQAAGAHRPRVREPGLGVHRCHEGG